MTTNSEKAARAAYERLDARKKLRVQSWRALGYPWWDSVINSGVLLTSGPLVRPEEAAWEAERERINQLIVEEQERRNLTGEQRARKETAQHEAAHLIVAQSFGLKGKLAAVRSDNSGTCMFEPAKTPFQTAAIALAGECWITVFCSRDFLGLAGGCDDDRRAAISALHGDEFELDQAWNYAWKVLRDNQDAVRTVADRIERDGHYLP